MTSNFYGYGAKTEKKKINPNTFTIHLGHLGFRYIGGGYGSYQLLSNLESFDKVDRFEDMPKAEFNKIVNWLRNN